MLAGFPFSETMRVTDLGSHQNQGFLQAGEAGPGLGRALRAEVGLARLDHLLL